MTTDAKFDKRHEARRRAVVPRYEVVGGTAYLLLTRPGERSETERCAFCGFGHVHSEGDGHRVSHCRTGAEEAVVVNGRLVMAEVRASDGTILRNEDGYVVRTVVPTL